MLYTKQYEGHQHLTLWASRLDGLVENSSQYRQTKCDKWFNIVTSKP